MLNSERQRLEAQHEGRENWRLWGPYLAERAWGTVREDYSEQGTPGNISITIRRARAPIAGTRTAWAASATSSSGYVLRWRCGTAAIPILKERAFGLTGNQGNHGEDVKEYYFYLDATPSHSCMRYLYKYPQAEYPYRLAGGREPAPLAPGSAVQSCSTPACSTTAATGTSKCATRRPARTRFTSACSPPIAGRETATIHLLPTSVVSQHWSWGEPR